MEVKIHSKYATKIDFVFICELIIAKSESP